MTLRETYQVLRQAVSSFIDDRVMTLSAALSFYTLLSFAPMLVLAVWVGSMLGYDAQSAVLQQIETMMGEQAREAARAVFNSANQRPSLGSIAGITGIFVSLVGATTVFAQLQTSLNQIWGIEAQPGKAIWAWLRRRILSVGVIAAIGFIMIVSLLISSALGIVLKQAGILWELLNETISTLVLAGLFMLLFRYLADAHLAWRRAIWGGLVTGALFAFGKWGIGMYLARGDVGGAYGAAGSLVVLLVWVYYSSAIFFFGAEIVQASFKVRNESIPAAENAVKVESAP